MTFDDDDDVDGFCDAFTTVLLDASFFKMSAMKSSLSEADDDDDLSVMNSSSDEVSLSELSTLAVGVLTWFAVVDEAAATDALDIVD